MGLVEGTIIALAMHVASQYTNSLVVGAILTLLHILVTGGLHLDGLADYVDAVASGKRGEEAVRVMRDPCTGGVAAAVVAVTLIAKTAGLASAAATELVVAYIAASESMYIAARLSRPAPSGIARTFITRAKTRPITLNLAVLAATLVVPALLEPHTVALILTAAVVPALVARDASRRIGYMTGDVLGSTYEITHTVALIAAAATPP